MKQSDICYFVEEHITSQGRDGIGNGRASGRYASAAEAAAAMRAAIARGKSASCIKRFSSGFGTLVSLAALEASAAAPRKHGGEA